MRTAQSGHLKRVIIFDVKKQSFISVSMRRILKSTFMICVIGNSVAFLLRHGAAKSYNTLLHQNKCSNAKSPYPEVLKSVQSKMISNIAADKR